MTSNKTKPLLLLLAFLLVLPALSSTVLAATNDPESFHIQVDVNESISDPDTQARYNTKIYLYQVADATVDSNGNLHMQPVELYEDITFDGLAQDAVPDLVKELCERLDDPNLSDTAPNLAPLAVETPGEDGVISFEHLDAGVYLLMKWSQDEPVKLEMLPVLVYLPAYHGESGMWQHSVTVYPKFAWTPDPPIDPPAITPDPTLPQTGMVQWPIPVLVLSGLLLFAIGYGMERRMKEE